MLRYGIHIYMFTVFIIILAMSIQPYSYKGNTVLS